MTRNRKATTDGLDACHYWPIQVRFPAVQGFTLWGYGDGERDEVPIVGESVALVRDLSDFDLIRRQATAPRTQQFERAFEVMVGMDRNALLERVVRYDFQLTLTWMFRDPSTWRRPQRIMIVNCLHLGGDVAEMLANATLTADLSYGAILGNVTKHLLTGEAVELASPGATGAAYAGLVGWLQNRLRVLERG